MTKELMSIDEITCIEIAGFTSIIKIEEELRRLFETARAAHELQTININLQAANNKLNEDVIMLKKESEKLRKQLTAAIDHLSDMNSYITTVRETLSILGEK